MTFMNEQCFAVNDNDTDWNSCNWSSNFPSPVPIAQPVTAAVGIHDCYVFTPR